VKLYTDNDRIRALVRAVRLKTTTSVAAFRMSIAVPYIRIKAATGRFIKRLVVNDSLTASTEGGSYFAEDYVQFGYTISSFVLEVRKGRADDVGVVDEQDVTSAKDLADGAGAAETVARRANAVIIDAPAVADSGSLRMQDYCAFDYFAEGYVGTSLTF